MKFGGVANEDVIEPEPNVQVYAIVFDALLVTVVFAKLTVNGAEPEMAPAALDDKLDVTVNPAVTVGAVMFNDCVTDAVALLAILVAFKVTAKLLPVVE